MTLISHFDFFVSFVLLLSLFVYIEELTHVHDLGSFSVRVSAFCYQIYHVDAIEELSK